MSPDSVGPFSRPIPLHRITPAGLEVEVEASVEERAALAADLDLPAIHRLRAEFRLTGSTERIRVEGRLGASIEQTCVVSLEPFPTEVDEEVAVEFAAGQSGRRGRDAGPAEIEIGETDPPDELVGDHIDLGAITAEFLALGLDPYPKRPGIAFEPPPEETPSSPFARLAALRDGEPDG